MTRHDVLKVYAASDAETFDNVRAALHRRGFGPPRHHIDLSVYEGVVTLNGTTIDTESVYTIVTLVRAMDGVVAIQQPRAREPFCRIALGLPLRLPR